MAVPLSRNDPEIIQVLRQYRQELIDREEQQTNRLASSWIELERSLDSEMFALAAQIQDAVAQNKIITEQLIRRFNRYEKLQDQMKARTLHWVANVAVPDIEAEQMAFGELAIQAASDVIKMNTGIGFSFDRLPKDAVETYVGLLGDGTPLYRLLKEAYPDALDGIVKSILFDASKGLSPIQMAQNMADGFGAGLDRATLIARTEQLRVNRLVSAEQYRSSGLDGVMRRVAAKDGRACMACLVSDGEIIGLEEELDDHPRGRCVAIFQVKGAAYIHWEKGAEWFARQEEPLQRQMMGDKKYDLWKAGAFNLEELRQNRYDPIWGNNPRVATIEELLKGRNIESFIAKQPKVAPVAVPRNNPPVPVASLPTQIDPNTSTDVRTSASGIKIVPSNETRTKGVFDSERVTIVGNGDAIIKTDDAPDYDGWGDLEIHDGFAHREVGMYEIDQLLGLNIVPKTVPFIEDGEYKSMQLWINKARTAASIGYDKPVELKDLQAPGRLTLLDFIGGNTDRHGNNWIVDSEGKMFAIDNGLQLTRTGTKLDRDRFISKMEDVFKNLDDFYKDIPEYKLKLSSSYRDALDKAIKDGSLKKALLKAAETSSDDDAKQLAAAALLRAKRIVKKWDDLFYED